MGPSLVPLLEMLCSQDFARLTLSHHWISAQHLFREALGTQRHSLSHYPFFVIAFLTNWQLNTVCFSIRAGILSVAVATVPQRLEEYLALGWRSVKATKSTQGIVHSLSPG